MAEPEPTRDIPIPRGLDNLLDEMACQVLRYHPDNMLEFLANYLEDKLRKRDQPNSSDNTASTSKKEKDAENGKDSKDKDKANKDLKGKDSKSNVAGGSGGNKDSAAKEEKPKPGSLTRRIEELSAVLNDALDKGQKLGDLHRSDGSTAPDGASGKDGNGGSTDRDGSSGSGNSPDGQDASSGSGKTSEGQDGSSDSGKSSDGQDASSGSGKTSEAQDGSSDSDKSSDSQDASSGSGKTSEGQDGSSDSNKSSDGQDASSGSGKSSDGQDGSSGSGKSPDGQDGSSGSGKSPDGEDGSKGPDGAAENLDEDHRRGSTFMIGKDKVTYRGSLANNSTILANEVNALIGSRAAEQDTKDKSAAGHGDANPKPDVNSLTRRIDELSKVLGDTLTLGKKFGDAYRPDKGSDGGEGTENDQSGEGPSQQEKLEQIEAERAAQALIDAEVEKEKQMTQDLELRKNQYKNANQEKNLRMLILQIEDMSQAVDLALALLGPVENSFETGRPVDNGGQDSSNSARSPGSNNGQPRSVFTDGTQGPSQFQNEAGPSNRPGDLLVGDTRGTNNYPEARVVPFVHPGGDLRTNNGAAQAIARIDQNMPEQWRNVDLTEAGRALNQGMRAGMGRHLDTMRRLLNGEMAFAEAPYHAVILGVGLGIVTAVGISAIQAFWKAIY